LKLEALARDKHSCQQTAQILGRKEVKPMNYSKPEVRVLGSAKTAIENTQIKMGSGFDPGDAKTDLIPAYDLDE
jgi:hypothetical protein